LGSDPVSRTVVAELQAVPWAWWDGDAKAWRVPFRSVKELKERWPAIEAAPAETSPRRGEKDETNERVRQSTGRALGAPRKDVDNATRFRRRLRHRTSS